MYSSVRISKICKGCKKEKILPAIIFIFAFAIRIFYLFDISDSPFSGAPLIDARFHDDWALKIINGDWLSQSQGAFCKTPLYPYFMALVYKVFGHSYFILKLIQLAFGSLSCVFIYLLGKKYFSPLIAFTASVISSLYSTFIFFEGEMEIVFLSVFLNLWLLLQLTNAAKTQKKIQWFFAGTILGLSALAMPNILLFLPFVLIWIAITFKKTGYAKKAALWGAVFSLGVATIVLPVTIRNYMMEGDFVLISANGGLNFFIGNNTNTDKTTAIRPGAEWDHFFARPFTGKNKKITRAEADNRWLRKAEKFIKEHPLEFSRLLLKKFYLFFHSYEIKRNKDIYFSKQYSFLLQLPLFNFSIVSITALLGMFLSRRQYEDYLLLYFYLAAQILSVVLFFVTARYRLPSVPIFILFSAQAVELLWKIPQGKKTGR